MDVLLLDILLLLHLHDAWFFSSAVTVLYTCFLFTLPVQQLSEAQGMWAGQAGAGRPGGDAPGL